MEALNSWWRREQDSTVQEWMEAPLDDSQKKYSMSQRNLSLLNSYLVQVGKTTSVKLLIHRLLEKEEGSSAFYYSCDELTDYKELGEVLDNFWKR